MRRCAVALTLLALLAVTGIGAMASDATQPSTDATSEVTRPETPTVPSVDEVQMVTVKNTVAPREVREYNVSAVVTGRMLEPGTNQPMDLDTSFAYKIRHRYLVRDTDGLLPLEISVIQGEITSKGQKLTIAPSIYPKLTALLDRSWRVDSIFGISRERLTRSSPGINYGNMIILFYLAGGDEPHTVGSKWNSKIKLPGYGETYDVTTTLTAVEKIGDAKVATVRQEMAWNVVGLDDKTIATATATVDSSFALENGRLMKSHVECCVVSKAANDAKEDAGKNTANIRIDISLAANG